ncbi:MAG: hypothetical protein LLF92_07130 [Planctomycetaceae bacterium]|nr:hypothetical protein [Planctomycetaceae bacterium]
MDVNRDYSGGAGSGGWWACTFEEGRGPRIMYQTESPTDYPMGPAVTPDGVPFFPYGWWYNVEAGQDGPTIDAAFAQMQTLGANAVIVANGPAFNKSLHDTYLFYAKKYGLKVVFGISGGEVGRLNRGLLVDDREAMQAIASDCHNANFLGYTVGDELLDSASVPTVEQQQWIADQAHSWKPKTMVFQNWETTQAEADYNDRLTTVDTVCYDRYPIAYSTPVMNYSTLTSLISQVNEHKQNSTISQMLRGLLLCSQAVGNDFSYGGQTNYYRYPTLNEQRYITWSSVASNYMRGMYYFEYNDLANQSTAYQNFLTNVMGPLMQELRLLENGLETGYDVGTVTTTYDANLWSGKTVKQVGKLLVKDETGYYLILANNMSSSATVNVSISNLPVALNSLTATLVNETGTGKDTRTLTQVSGTYTMSIPMTSLDVDIYHLEVAHCSTSLAGDIDGNCVVNFEDFSLMASQWLQCNWSDSSQCH